MIYAAGIMFQDMTGRVLLLRRSYEGDAPGVWALPGGKVEDGEDAEEAAIRECKEEIGACPDGKRTPLCRTNDGHVDYTTFLQMVPEPFEPVLNEEHDAFKWAPVSALAPAQDTRTDSNFEESEHPREGDGKFAAGAGGASARPGVRTKTENGKRVQESGAALPEHIAKLKIPPAWTDVRYNADAGADLLAVGKDSKGRPQAIYSDAHWAQAAAEKFARIEKMDLEFPQMRAQNQAARKSADPKTKDAADCLDLIMKMGVRPGSENDTGAQEKAYGATTLKGAHVVLEGERVFLRFIGKKGVALNLLVEDKELSKMLLARKKATGSGGKLFPATSDKGLLDHVHSLDHGQFKTKDFRTFLGTRTAYDLVGRDTPPKTPAEYKKKVLAVAKAVSAKLGNTPTIALQSYINPVVFSEWKMALT